MEGTKQKVWTLGFLAVITLIISAGTLAPKNEANRAPSFRAMSYPQAK